jgi:transposase InsO family protein
VNFAFIQAQKAEFPVEMMCQHLEVSHSGFYAWCHREPSLHQRQDQILGQQIQHLHQRSRGTYGRPRVHAVLRAHGTKTSSKRVHRLLDLFSRRVIGWSMGAQIDADLCLDALQMALLTTEPPPGLVHHTDRGSQYASGDYQAALLTLGFVGSMSRKGNCWDNAVAESFFATLNGELCDHRCFATRAEARQVIFEYIEVFYNRQRIHSTLDYATPTEYEALYSQSTQAA